MEAQADEKVGAVGLWNTICSIVRGQGETEYPYIIICEDDHQFSKNYTKDGLFNAISEAEARNADILSGGVSWSSSSLPVTENLFWFETFSGFQFTILFRKFFKCILGAEFTSNDAADFKMATLTPNKFVIHPFISIQKGFGYSDATPKNNGRKVEEFFETATQKIDLLNNIYNWFGHNEKRIPIPLISQRYQDREL